MTPGFSLAILFALSLGGCLSPLATHHAVLEYDRTVSYLDADLLLLNIARARHHRPVHFTAVSSVAATFEFRANAGIQGGLGHVVDPRERPLNLEYGMGVAENPTITIVPITGEEFTKRILRPLDEDKLEFLVHQGYEINLLLRLMARGLIIDTEKGAMRQLINHSASGDGYAEFRRRLLHLAWLEAERYLHVESLRYEEVYSMQLHRPPDATEVVSALEKGFRWKPSSGEQTHQVGRTVVGRLLIANYDPKQLPNEERIRLNNEAQQYPEDYVLVDIRPGFPGGDYPLHGLFMLRSMNAIIGFVARSIEEEPETSIMPDPRTKTVVRNPLRTLAIEESTIKPADFEFSVSFGGRHYSLPKSPIPPDATSTWNHEAFAVLSNLFQMTVTDLSKYPSPAITIAK